MSVPDPMKEIQKVLWSLGDYEALTKKFTHGTEILGATGVAPGMDVLDVAAGTGKIARAAAALGANVVATDLTPAMVERGRAESEAAGLRIEWREADAEDLPFPGGSFDRVLSSFGAIFAPHPDAVASELYRVLRPGGKIGMANWTAEGYMGRRMETMMRRTPAPDPMAALRWGDPDFVRARFAGMSDRIAFTPQEARFEFGSVTEMREFFDRLNGPQIAARSTLPPDVYQEILDETDALTVEYNQATDGSVVLDAAWLLVVVDKPQVG